MSIRYPIPAKETRTEIVVVNSRFITTAGSAFSVEEARQFIQKIKAEFPDASHHVPAYLIGYGTSVTAHCSDAGEPSGTAGRPLLAVLQGSGLGDIVMVVTRYFGGTKLGTGGLVRAYTEAARSVLDILPLAEKIPTHTVMLVVPYSMFEQVRLLITSNHGILVETVFEVDVTIVAQFAVERYPLFEDELRELSRGTLEPVIIESNPGTIMPVGSFKD